MTRIKLILTIIITCLFIGVSEGYYYIHDKLTSFNATAQVVKQTDYIPKDIMVSKVKAEVQENIHIEKEKPVKTFALLGSDTRIEGGAGRSDVIMIIQLNPNTRTINYVSIPRDSYVDIIGKGYKDKINHAMAYGLDYSIDTIENLLGVTLDNYFVIDFHSFERVIDTLGGVEVDVEYPFREQNKLNQKWAVSIPQGHQTLTGEQALAYARMRKQDAEGDIGRAKRQQQIIESLLNKVSETTTYEKVKLGKVILDEVKTDVGIKQIVDLTDYVIKYDTINKIVLSGRGMRIDNIYYLDLDDSLQHAKTILAEGKETLTSIIVTNDKQSIHDIKDELILDN